MLLQQNIAQSFQSPIVRILLATIALGLLYILWREVRKIPAKLFALMATAFVDMVGLLMIIPLLPFYAKSMGAGGLVVGLLVSSFSIAQLLMAPVWGRLSDHYGRRPALIVGMTASAIEIGRAHV